MNKMIAKERCCCFTGHRPEKLNVPEYLVVQRLDAAICDAIEQGCTTFLSGAAKGVDYEKDLIM